MSDMQKINKQLKEMMDVIVEVKARIHELEQRQDDELFGRIDGMSEQIAQATLSSNTETRRQLLIGAITFLNEARSTIVRELLRRLQEIKDTPKNAIGVIFKQMADKSFYSETIQTYDRIEILFQYYMNTTYLLAKAYLELNEPQVYLQIFTPPTELVENKCFEKLIHAEGLFNEKIGETWYKNPERYLIRLREASNLIFGT